MIYFWFSIDAEGSIYSWFRIKLIFFCCHKNLLGSLLAVTFLHAAVMATVVMCRVRNPACTATSALGKERYINGQQEAPLTLWMWRYINGVHLRSFDLWSRSAKISRLRTTLVEGTIVIVEIHFDVLVDLLKVEIQCFRFWIYEECLQQQQKINESLNELFTSE